MRVKKNNLFENVPKKSADEIFETLIKNNNVRIERIISTGQNSPEGFWYDQDEDEFVLILQGSAELEFVEGNKISSLRMQKGDWILIPAHVKHRVVSTDKNIPTIWLAVFIKDAK